MAESLINSIARLRVIEKGLLTPETVGRLLSSRSYAECLKIMTESGYGMDAGSEGDELESMIRYKLTQTYALVEELMPKRFAGIAKVFRMKHDVTNIKLLYKLRLQGLELGDASLDFGGIYDGEKLKAAIAKGDYSMLPKQFVNALEELDVTTYKAPDPQAVSCSIDGAYINYAYSLKNGFVREYFGALADFTNILAITRGFTDRQFLPVGEYSAELLRRIGETYGSSPEQALYLIKNPMETSPLKDAVRKCFAEYMRTGHTSAIERERDEYLLRLASRSRSDIESPAPIVGYQLAREREAEVVRLILTAKRSDIPAEALEERSVALYG